MLGGAVLPDGLPAVAHGLVFYGLMAALGLVALWLWLVLLHDAMGGRLSRFPIFSGIAVGIERLFALLQRFPA
jgi:hypothetical protein